MGNTMNEADARVGHRKVHVWSDNEGVANFTISSIFDVMVEFEGQIRFDGCMNYNTRGVRAHMCEQSDADDLAKAFRKVWDLAQRVGVGE
jgi:hypothetical protein